MGIIGDGLDRAVQSAFTRPIPKSAGAQMRYLVKQLKGTRAVAGLLGVSQRTVERYVKDQIRRPRADLAQRLEDAVRQRWQPRVRDRARVRLWWHPYWETVPSPPAPAARSELRQLARGRRAVQAA